ncbi:hypothetical protein LTR53_001145 [Teratosphaeriaceae sp. CCFEE 6253]|nr:hypothetical protein LTR53_001145 [Teratosphaeriaceae sp. CCFEE 6253]
MPFPFLTFTSLLTALEAVEVRDPPLLPQPKAAVLKAETERWFKAHRHSIDGLDVRSAVALLSSLLPERRTDRVYGIQAPGLCRILCRSLGLSASRTGDLQAYKQPRRGDLGHCLKRVLKSNGPPARPAVTLEEVDEMLEVLASQCRFSDRSIIVSLPTGSSEIRDKVLGDVFKRVTPDEGMWLVRLILKDFAPVQIDERLLLRQFHFLLPDFLRFQDNFGAAIRLLKEDPTLRQLPERPDPRSECLFRQTAAAVIRPQVGTKVGRPTFLKARSIDNCMQLLGAQRWVLERKYDGEYCEIHIDLGKSVQPAECIRIFSKSGKDSTADREGLHQTLVECLRLGRPDCRIKKQAILLGELVVFSDETTCILPFDKIRKHVSRSGISLGTKLDSQPHAYEQLGIVFFDLLLWDDEVVMSRSVDERRQWLREIYRKIPGRAMSAEWKTVDFADSARARRLLMEQFAASIVQRCEGLILKPCGVPYFSLDIGLSQQRHYFIKLKKDYIAGMGDEADFAIVGASHDAQQALSSGIRGIKWTDFHLGCMTNKADVQRFDAKPVFHLVGTMQQEACIPRPILETLNMLSSHLAIPYGDAHEHFKLEGATAKIDVLFRMPPVLEILGSGFDKPSNCDFYMLRHARATKLHQDRSWRDCVSFQELQDQARTARSAPTTAVDELAETREWIGRMETKLRRRLDRIGTLTPKSRRSTPSKARKDASTDLPRSTLVQCSSLGIKRASPVDRDTPCPEVKKRRSTSSQIRGVIRVPDPTPLSDITNQTSGRDAVTARIAAATQCTPLRGPDLIDAAQANAACLGTRCPFNGAAVVLAPRIENSSHVAESLLLDHQTVVTAHLRHWDRDSLAHSEMTETVAESQAYAGLRKIVLVGSKQRQAIELVVKNIVALNRGGLRERIEVHDWRVLADCTRHDQAGDKLKQHFVGATMYVEAEERAIFVSRIPGLGHL